MGLAPTHQEQVLSHKSLSHLLHGSLPLPLALSPLMDSCSRIAPLTRSKIHHHSRPANRVDFPQDDSGYTEVVWVRIESGFQGVVKREEVRSFWERLSFLPVSAKLRKILSFLAKNCPNYRPRERWSPIPPARATQSLLATAAHTNPSGIARSRPYGKTRTGPDYGLRQSRTSDFAATKSFVTRNSRDSEMCVRAPQSDS